MTPQSTNLIQIATIEVDLSAPKRDDSRTHTQINNNVKKNTNYDKTYNTFIASLGN